MSAQRVLVAALSGFVAGVAVGLMVAPASGSEIRQRIADSAGDFAGDVKDKIRNLRGKAEDELGDLGLDTEAIVMTAANKKFFCNKNPENFCFRIFIM
jgi:gas vesicle protein